MAKQGQLFGTGGKRLETSIDAVAADMDRAFYLRELASEECQCGLSKNKGQSFCIRCYRKLPREIQSGLYAKIGQGYEEAREQAARFLED